MAVCDVPLWLRWCGSWYVIRFKHIWYLTDCIVALGGWIVTFMIRVRKATHFASGMTATGFWLGLTVGRVTLGFLTPRIGERLAISVRFRDLNDLC